MQIDPTEYREQLNTMRLYHHVCSVISTATLIALSWLSFSANSPLKQENAKQGTFNVIAYPIYAGLIIIAGAILYYIHTPYAEMFSDENNSSSHANNTPENLNEIKMILDEHKQTFHISAEPLVQIINNRNTNALVFQFTSCSAQHLLINTGYLSLSKHHEASLPILLAHELMHFEYDLPYVSLKRFPHLLYVFNLLFLSFGYMPMQLGFTIAGAATMEFQPAFVYLPIIGFFLTLFVTLNFFQEIRTRERNADYCALFGDKKFDKIEYDRQKTHYSKYSRNLSCFAQLLSTHPPISERFALIEAAEKSFQQPAVITS